MQRVRNQTPRRGVTMVETAITLTVFFTLILGFLDLSLCTFRYHTLSNAAREGARKAIVHGNLTPRKLSIWGPGTTTVGGNDGGEIALAVKPFLHSMDPATVSIKVEWLDGDNAPESRVKVTISTTHSFLLTSLFGNTVKSLTASSTMRITH